MVRVRTISEIRRVWRRSWAGAPGLGVALPTATPLGATPLISTVLGATVLSATLLSATVLSATVLSATLLSATSAAQSLDNPETSELPRSLDPTRAQRLDVGPPLGLLPFPGVTANWAYTTRTTHPGLAESTRLTRALNESATGVAVTADGSIVMGGAHQSLQALDREGNLRWTIALSSPLAAPPVLSNGGDILALNQEGQLLRITTGGKVLHSAFLATPKGSRQAAPVVIDSGQTWASVDELLFELDANGQPRSLREFPSRIAILAALGSEPVAATVDGSIWRWNSLGQYRVGKVNGRLDQLIPTRFGMISLVSGQNLGLVSREGRSRALVSFDNTRIVSNLVWSKGELSLVTSDGQLRRYALEGRSLRPQAPVVLRAAKSSGSQGLVGPVAALGDPSGATVIAAAEGLWRVSLEGEVVESPPVCAKPNTLSSGADNSLLVLCSTGEIYKIR